MWTTPTNDKDWDPGIDWSPENPFFRDVRFGLDDDLVRTCVLGKSGLLYPAEGRILVPWFLEFLRPFGVRVAGRAPAPRPVRPCPF